MRSINHPVLAVLIAGTLVAGTILAPGNQAVSITHAAQPAVAQVRPDAAARVDTYFTKLVQAHKFSGAVLLAQGNTILLSKGYGMANWSRQIHNTASTAFPDPVTALEKFVAPMVLQLEDAGKLHEGDHICTYIPRCPATWAPITLHELLNFTSGIHDPINETTPGFSWASSFTLPALVQYLGTLRLDHRPGAGCCSWVSSIIVEEYLIERVTGESFATYLQSHVLQPLGLTHTGYFVHQPPSSLPVASYQSWQTLTTFAYDASSMGGMVYTTVTDFYHWLYAVFSGKVLSAAAAARILTPSFTFCPPQCLGLTNYSAMTTADGYVVATDHGVRVLVHWAGSGSTLATRSCTFRQRRSRLIILANQMDNELFTSSQVPLIFS